MQKEMPNFLKSLFHRQQTRTAAETHPRPISPSAVSPYAERPVPLPDAYQRSRTSTRDLEELADLLRTELASQRRSSANGSLSSEEGGRLRRFSSNKSRKSLEVGGDGSARTLNRLLEVLEEIKAGQSEGRISPFLDSKSDAAGADHAMAKRKGKARARSSDFGEETSSKGDWQQVMTSCTDALGARVNTSNADMFADLALTIQTGTGDLKGPLQRIANLLGAQRSELADLGVFERGRALPTLS